MAVHLTLLAGGVTILAAAYRRYRSTVGNVIGSLGLDLLGSVLIGSGVVIPLVVVALLGWSQNPHLRSYVITGPYPFDSLGSGSFLVWVATLGTVLGCILSSLRLVIRTWAFSSGRSDGQTSS